MKLNQALGLCVLCKRYVSRNVDLIYIKASGD